MRVLMLSTPYPSHVMPMVPLAWALRAAGHDVLVAAQPDVVDAVETAGLPGAVIGDRFHGLDVLLDALSGDQRLIQLYGRPDEDMLNLPFWQIHAAYLLPQYLRFAQRWRPDIVVSEQMEFAGQILGAALGVPTVRHRWGVDPMSTWASADCARSLHRTCRRLGLAGFPDPTLLLDPCPPTLQVPGVAPGRAIRAVPFNGPGRVPDWPAPERGTTRVCVTLGTQTAVLNGVPLYRGIVAALGALPGVETVVTLSREHWPLLGPLPSSVRLVPPTPLHLFLSTCDAVVHHGAANTTMTVCGFGLPQLVLPQLQDEFRCADRLAEVGAAVVLDDAAAQDDPGSVRAAAAALLGEPRHRAAAGRLAAEMAAMASPAEVAAELEELTTGATAGRSPTAH